MVGIEWEPAPAPRMGDLRVWYYRRGSMLHRSVASIDEAKRVINEQTQADLNDPTIICNDFGLELFGGYHEWCEWYDDQDRSITDLIEDENG